MIDRAIDSARIKAASRVSLELAMRYPGLGAWLITRVADAVREGLLSPIVLAKRLDYIDCYKRKTVGYVAQSLIEFLRQRDLYKRSEL